MVPLDGALVTEGLVPGEVVPPPATEVVGNAVANVPLAETDGGVVVGAYENDVNEVIRHFQRQSAIVWHMYPPAHGHLADVPVHAGFVSVYDVG